MLKMRFAIGLQKVGCERSESGGLAFSVGLLFLVKQRPARIRENAIIHGWVQKSSSAFGLVWMAALPSEQFPEIVFSFLN